LFFIGHSPSFSLPSSPSQVILLPRP
jgi:hypothetical protein